MLKLQKFFATRISRFYFQRVASQEGCSQCQDRVRPEEVKTILGVCTVFLLKKTIQWMAEKHWPRKYPPFFDIIVCIARLLYVYVTLYVPDLYRSVFSLCTIQLYYYCIPCTVYTTQMSHKTIKYYHSVFRVHSLRGHCCHGHLQFVYCTAPWLAIGWTGPRSSY